MQLLKNTPGNSAHFRRGCDWSKTYIFSFYFSPALKLIFQSKAKKRQTGLPTEMPNSCKTDRKESFCQVQQVWKKQMTLSGRLYQRERENRKSNQAQTQSHFLWQIPFHLLYAPLPKPSTMDHNASLLRVRCFKLVPLFAKQSPQRKAVKLAARDRKKKLTLLLPQTQWLYAATVKYLDQHCVSSLCVALARPYPSPLRLPFISQTLSCGNIKLTAAPNCKILSVKTRWRALLIPHGSTHSHSRWHLKLFAAWRSLFHLQPDALLTHHRGLNGFHRLSFYFCQPQFLRVPLIQILPERSTPREKLSDSFLSLLSFLQGEILGPIVPILQ